MLSHERLNVIVPERGIEPPPLARFDFESNAATNYATRAKLTPYISERVQNIWSCIKGMGDDNAGKAVSPSSDAPIL